jgi:lipoate-protein ligase A
VLHQGDLTYAISFPGKGLSRITSYRLICDALITGWRRMGVELHYGTAGRGYHQQANCFAVATAADLVTIEGYKLIGSAQLRRDGFILQQGTMRLWQNMHLMHQVFGATDLAPSPRIPPPTDAAWLQSLIAALQAELGQALGVTFRPQPLTPEGIRASYNEAQSSTLSDF